MAGCMYNLEGLSLRGFGIAAHPVASVTDAPTLDHELLCRRQGSTPAALSLWSLPQSTLMWTLFSLPQHTPCSELCYTWFSTSCLIQFLQGDISQFRIKTFPFCSLLLPFVTSMAPGMIYLTLSSLLGWSSTRAVYILLTTESMVPREVPGLQSSTNTRCTENLNSQTSLVAEWLQIHLPMQGTSVWSLVWEILHVGHLASCVITARPECPGTKFSKCLNEWMHRWIKDRRKEQKLWGETTGRGS